MKILAIIPARGGSKGIPRKNIRLLNGYPLIYYAINNAQKSKYISDVIVSTDDEEIANIASIYDCKSFFRPFELGNDDVTLDPVIYNAVTEYENKFSQVDIVITLQPTSPLLSTQTLDSAIMTFLKGNVDSLLSAYNNPYLSWKIENNKYIPNYEERLNRQQLPGNFVETGAFFITKREYVTPLSRLGNRLSIEEVPKEESIDIDDISDWIICETILKKKRIVIRTEGYAEIGLGHIYRSIQLHNGLLEHEVFIVISSKSDIGLLKLNKHSLHPEIIDTDDQFIDYCKKNKIDIVINDILDTSEFYIKTLKKFVKRVVNFEDLGSGTKYADAVINALYEKTLLGENFFWGEKYYYLRDEFLLFKGRNTSSKVNNILIMFGGTDPSGFTEKMLNVINSIEDNSITFQFILGLGFKDEYKFIEKCSTSDKIIKINKNVKSVRPYMEQADLAVSSQGRTLYELASIHVPTIVLAQNDREAEHKFACISNGFINLGNGNKINNECIKETLSWLIHTHEIRKQLSDNMKKVDLKNGRNRVKKIILGEELYD